MNPFVITDAVGVFVFALSGGMAASRQGMDLFGVMVVSLLPAIGGGTLRDLILDRPVFWLDQSELVLFALAGGALTWVVGDRIARFKTLIWLDAMGLALFAVIGAAVASSLDHSPVVVILMGTMTACFGGVLRDIVCNEVPFIFREGIYATAAVAGSAAYWLAHAYGPSDTLALVVGAGVTFTFRACEILIREIRPRPFLKLRWKRRDREG